MSELEGQISQLEKDLKIVKDQLCSTEALKTQAQKDVEESNQQLVALSLKLEESQKQLSQKSSEERHEISQSELEGVREQNSAALVSALDEIKQLKAQLEMVAESEATNLSKSESEQEEFRKLKEKLNGTLLIVENMKNELKESQESEAQAQKLVGETLMQLESAKKMVETLRSDGLKTMEDYNAIVSELEQSRARVRSLEELVSKLNADISNGSNREMETEVDSLKHEVEQLRSALKAAEMKHSEEQSQSEEEIQKAFELAEKIKSASEEREAELEMDIRKSKYEMEELKANLMDKETELQGICEENEGLNAKLESSLSGHRENELEKKLHESNSEIENLKARLMEKEMEWEKTLKENEKLKMEIKEVKTNDEAGGDIESARAGEREALMKVGYMMEEVEKSNRRAERVCEQLEAVQAANAEMEGELRKLKVQSEQWRKAAEAAAAMLSAGNNGQIMERTGSMDYSPRTGKISSPYGDDMDEDFLKKKNANVLKRFGVLWKKPQK